MRETLLKSLESYLKGNIQKHKANIEVYLNNTTGIGEHSDIIETIEKELDMLASYEDKFEVLNKHFSNTSEYNKKLLND